MSKPSLTPTDVIVIGSGPGGIAAAITCARAGLRVIIVSGKPNMAQEHPAESLHPGVASLLNELQITGAIEASAVGKYTGIKANDHYAPLAPGGLEEWEGVHI